MVEKNDIYLDIEISYMDFSVLKFIKTLYFYEDYSSVIVSLLGKYYNCLSIIEKKFIRDKALSMEKEYGKLR